MLHVQALFSLSSMAGFGPNNFQMMCHTTSYYDVLCEHPIVLSFCKRALLDILHVDYYILVILMHHWFFNYSGTI